MYIHTLTFPDFNFADFVNVAVLGAMVGCFGLAIKIIVLYMTMAPCQLLLMLSERVNGHTP
jgi:hypothetical protein